MKQFDKNLKKLILLCGFLFITLGGHLNVSAATPSYYISPVFSAHQSQGVTTFFDVRWTPNQRDKIGIKITNTTDATKNFEIKVNKARTNSNGVINYLDATKEASNSERPTLTSLVAFPQTVSVPAHQSQTFYSTISFPKTDFNGIKMGGVVVEERGGNQESQNLISYALPLIIRGNIDQRPTPQIIFGKFDLKQTNFHTFTLRLPISNKKATLLKNAQVEVKLLTSRQHLVWSKKNEFLITPETSFVYGLPINKRLKVGNYKVKVTLKHKGKVWNSTQTLKVSPRTSKKMAQTVPKVSLFSYFKNPIVWVVLVIFGLLVLLILFLLIRGFNKKRKKK